MDAQKVLTAHIDDIVFDGRNKSYGAYFLRKIYESHLKRALLIAGAVSLLALVGFKLAESDVFKKKDKPVAVEVQLEEPPALDKNEPPPPPPPPPVEPPPPPTATVRFVPPVIKKDELVNEEAPPPDITKLDTVQIAKKTQEGVKGPAPVISEPSDAPPAPIAVEPPPKPKEPEIFTVVEQSPEFPDGMAALQKYLANNIKYPALARENGIQGKVILQFVVDEEGSISDIKVVRGIGGGCDEEAIRVVKTMPKWKAGKQRGRPVKVRFTLPVSFRLE